MRHLVLISNQISTYQRLNRLINFRIVRDPATKMSFKELLNLQKALPFLSWLDGYDSQKLTKDLIAGLTVTVVLIPQVMAYASLAGLPPVYGLYAAFLGTAVAALWGSSRHLSTGPVALVSFLTLTALVPLAKAETAELKALVAQGGVRLRGQDLGEFCGCVHALLLGTVQCVWQISAHFSTDSSPLQVCSTITPGSPTVRNW